MYIHFSHIRRGFNTSSNHKSTNNKDFLKTDVDAEDVKKDWGLAFKVSFTTWCWGCDGHVMTDISNSVSTWWRAYQTPSVHDDGHTRLRQYIMTVISDSVTIHADGHIRLRQYTCWRPYQIQSAHDDGHIRLGQYMLTVISDSVCIHADGHIRLRQYMMTAISDSVSTCWRSYQTPSVHDDGHIRLRHYNKQL